MNWLYVLHEKLDPIALRILKWMNGLVGVVMVGVTAFSAARPTFAADVAAALHLNAFEGAALGIAWCSLVAYIARRAAKNAA